MKKKFIVCVIGKVYQSYQMGNKKPLINEGQTRHRNNNL